MKFATDPLETAMSEHDETDPALLRRRDAMGYMNDVRSSLRLPVRPSLEAMEEKASQSRIAFGPLRKIMCCSCGVIDVANMVEIVLEGAGRKTYLCIGCLHLATAAAVAGGRLAVNIQID